MEFTRSVPKSIPIKTNTNKSTTLITGIQRNPPQGIASSLAATYRLSIWSSLLILQSALPSCETAQRLVCELGLQNLLGVLIKLTPIWGHLNTTTPTTFPKPYSSINTNGPSYDNYWIPEYRHLLSMVFATACSFTYEEKERQNYLTNNIRKHDNKNKFATSIETRIHNSKQQKEVNKSSSHNHSGGMLYQLLSLGLSTSIENPLKCLSLSLIASLAKSTITSNAPSNDTYRPSTSSNYPTTSNSGNYNMTNATSSSTSSSLIAQFLSIGNLLNISIQQYLHSSTRNNNTDKMNIIYLIEAYSACVCAESQSTTNAGSTSKSNSSSMNDHNNNTNNGSKSCNSADNNNNLPDFQILSVPDLLVWVKDSIVASAASSSITRNTSRNATVLASIIRCIGLIATTALLSPTSSSSLINHSSTNNNSITNTPTTNNLHFGNITRSRLLANIVNEKQLNILLHTLYEQQTPSSDMSIPVNRSLPTNAVKAIAAASLWVILHYSEKARAIVKNQLTNAVNTPSLHSLFLSENYYDTYQLENPTNMENNYVINILNHAQYAISELMRT